MERAELLQIEATVTRAIVQTDHLSTPVGARERVESGERLMVLGEEEAGCEEVRVQGMRKERERRKDGPPTLPGRN